MVMPFLSWGARKGCFPFFFFFFCGRGGAFSAGKGSKGDSAREEFHICMLGQNLADEEKPREGQAHYHGILSFFLKLK